MDSVREIVPDFMGNEIIAATEAAAVRRDFALDRFLRDNID